MRHEKDVGTVEALRRFWGRVVFLIGMLTGFLPFILLPPTIASRNASSGVSLIFIAAIFNRLTIFPACALAFWRRGVASWWLMLDAGLLFVAFIAVSPHAWPDSGLLLLQLAVAAFLGLFGVITGAKRWPPLVKRKRGEEPAAF